MDTVSFELEFIEEEVESFCAEACFGEDNGLSVFVFLKKVNQIGVFPFRRNEYIVFL